MRASEFITEIKVKSSWIADIEYKPFDRSLIITLLNNKKYKVHNINFTTVVRIPFHKSKGKFWHQFIKNKYKVTRYFG